jgi:hypothetical protein
MHFDTLLCSIEYDAMSMYSYIQGAPLNEADHCGDPPLLLAAGNGALLSF